MKCSTCGEKLVTRVATDEAPYAYTVSGLDNVYLVGITVQVCSHTSHGEVPTIPRMGELHRLIADWLINKPSKLRGKELRFLRKNMEFSSKKFARLLGITPEHLSRVENDSVQELGDSNDQHVRLIAKAALEEVGKDYLDEIAEAPEKKQRKVWVRQTFALEGHQWIMEKKAA